MIEDHYGFLRGLEKQFPGQSIEEVYVNSRKQYYKEFQKRFPIIYKTIFQRRYVLPNYRQPDYYNQMACDYLMCDSMFAYLEGKMDVRTDQVTAHCWNNFMCGLHFNRPTYYLEKELGFPLLRSKLPLDFTTDDIQWKYEAMRIYLPKGLLTITRGENTGSIMFLDICKTPKGRSRDIPKSIDLEIKNCGVYFPGRLPIMNSLFDGFTVSAFMGFDSFESATGYAVSSKLENKTVRDIMEYSHSDLRSHVKTDEIDKEFLYRMLGLGINLLLFLSATPMEYEQERELRKPKMEGKHFLSGLYPARFIGSSQLRPSNKPAHIASLPTGKHVASHWKAGHWKRQPYGKGRTERKLIWILSYHAGEEEDEK
jgi:hypothetical protein